MDVLTSYPVDNVTLLTILLTDNGVDIVIIEIT